MAHLFRKEEIGIRSQELEKRKEMTANGVGR